MSVEADLRHLVHKLDAGTTIEQINYWEIYDLLVNAYTEIERLKNEKQSR